MLLESAREYFKKAKNETNAVLCDEQRKLLSKQKELSEKFNKKELIDLSLQDTIYALLMMREIKIAEELRCIFRLSDRKYEMLHFSCCVFRFAPCFLVFRRVFVPVFRELFTRLL